MRTTALLVCFALCSATATAAECEHNSLTEHSTLNVRVDNDLFGGIEQDQGYTQGFLVSLVSPNLLNLTQDPCMPEFARKVNRLFSKLKPKRGNELNMTIGLAQLMFTPTDPKPSQLIATDRPYAGALLFGVGYNAREGNDLRTSQLRLGVVGPAALAKPIQSRWHDLIGVDRFNGWDNQLHNEPVLQFIHERRKRVAQAKGHVDQRWDVISHWGGSLGNFATYANVGAELRFGYLVPDDFGTAPLRPAGENTAPIHGDTGRNWRGHLFVAVDGRWVLRDVTLDGNTFRDSHQVDKRPFVGDVGYGVAMTYGDWRVAFARYHRSREYEGQQAHPTFGSVTIGRRF